MGPIVAIGGGELSLRETLAIDEHIVRLTHKAKPRALFIPTASSDAEGYAASFRDVYGSELGCETDLLYLVREQPSREEIQSRILGADLIYVGGGNTKMMMEVWHKSGTSGYLRQAWESGTVLSGLSAGSVCWFEQGISDSMSFTGAEDWEYITVDGLGFIEGLHSPHYDERRDDERFRRFLRRCDTPVIAIENNCAMEFSGQEYRVISSAPGSRAWLIRMENGMATESELQAGEYRDISTRFSS